MIEVTDVTNGGFLDGDVDAAFYEPTNDIDNTNGLIYFGMVQQNSPSDPMTQKTGQGDLIQVTFKSLIPNAAADIINDDESSILVDWLDAFAVDFFVENGTVTTSSCPPTLLGLS